jgi:hypothetical protein
MRRAICLVCLLTLGGVTQAQYIANYLPPADPTYRGPYLADRYYQNSQYRGDMSQGFPRTATGGFSTITGQYWRNTVPQRPLPRFFHYPNYPGLNYSPPAAARANVLSPPPHPHTPYHDPFFEENFWHALRDGRDAYDYWGW